MTTIKHTYVKLFKPYGYVSQFIANDKNAKRKRFLGALHNFEAGTMAVGRLDETSEGLLFLTTDGRFSNHICSTSIEKEYYVQVDGVITDEAIVQLQQGVNISVNGKTYKTKPSKAGMLNTPSLPERAQKIRDSRHGPTSWIRIIISEGKFRQVRKMTAAVGFPTLRLVRYRIGPETIEGMKPGDVLPINADHYKPF